MQIVTREIGAAVELLLDKNADVCLNLSFGLKTRSSKDELYKITQNTSNKFKQKSTISQIDLGL